MPKPPAAHYINCPLITTTSTLSLNDGTLLMCRVLQREEREKQVDSIRRYFKEDLRSHGGYAINFFLCELLTLVNVVGQIYFTDRFLGHQFTTYGLDVVKMTTMDPEDRA